MPVCIAVRPCRQDRLIEHAMVQDEVCEETIVSISSGLRFGDVVAFWRSLYGYMGSG